MNESNRSEDAIFLEAVELPSESARAEYLDQVCHQDFALRGRVERLLANAPLVGTFLEKPAFQQTLKIESNPLSGDLTGQEFGPYKLLAKLGEGGMGEVYLAKQETPVKRRVALKVIRVGMGTDQIISRFEQERQALSLMDHPNIAHVLDAGDSWRPGSKTQLPYFAMDLVNGISITQYCDQEQLTISQRLELFIPVCQATQHAHQKGIIHRDLKPSNVLVGLCDGVPIPKVIDFGVSKAIAPNILEQTIATHAGQMIGTLEYMSPEQADSNNNDIDTRTDIYSLGVLLYVLVTGSPPLSSNELQASGLAEMLRIIKEVEPNKPSVRIATATDLPVIATKRQLEPRRLVNLVRGDLDWIIMKCLEKERGRRYETANCVAQDLQRYLAGETILARPPTFGYQLQKLVQKHRFPIGFIAACGLLLAVACLVSVRQAIRAFHAERLAVQGWAQAEQRRKQSDDVNEFMHEFIASVEPDAKGANVRLIDSLADASAAARERFAGNPIQEALVHSMLGEVYANLSMLNEASVETKNAKDLLKSALPADDHRVLKAEVKYALALMNQAKFSSATTALDGLLPRVQRVFGRDDPVAFEAERLTISILRSHRKYDECISGLRMLNSRAELVEANDATRISIINSLIGALKTRLTNKQGIDRSIVQEIEILAGEMAERSQRHFGAEALMTMRARTFVAKMLVFRGEYARAESIAQHIVDSTEERLGKAHVQRLEAMDTLADAKLRLGKPAEAADLQLRHIECARRGGGDVITMIGRLGDSLSILDAGKRWIEGECLAREYAAELKQYSGHDDMVLGADVYIAKFVSMQGREDEAQLLFQELLPRVGAGLEGSSTAARLHMFYGGHLRRKEHFEEAEKQLELAARLLPEIRRGTCLANPDDLILEFIALYEVWGKPDKKARYDQLLGEVQYALVENVSR